MNNNFINEEYQKQFDEKGWVKVPLVNYSKSNDLQSDVSELINNHIHLDTNYHVTLLSADELYRNKVKKLSFDFFQVNIDTYLRNYSVFTANLIIKTPSHGEMPIHQNWTFADEQKYTTFTFWFCLSDVDIDNGCLWFLNGSHKYFRDIIRGPNIPYFFISYQDQIKKRLTPVPLKKGELLIFDDSIIHYSDHNNSPYTRVAFQSNAIPKNVNCFLFKLKPYLLTKKIIGVPISSNEDVAHYSNASTKFKPTLYLKNNAPISFNNFMNRMHEIL